MNPPRIFISHAWEDKAPVRRWAAELKAAGADVWVDHAGIRGGDNLPKRINDALAWCNTLLLVWSEAAADSHWVELEWTNAISLRKLIVPCPIDGTPVPPIMANTAYIDVSDHEQGVRELLRALQLAQTGGKDLDAESELAGVIHARLTQVAPPPIHEPPQDEPTIIQLRHTPINPLSAEAAQQMLREKNFYATDWTPSGKGIRHEYESVERHGAALVIDHANGLVWQKSGSEKSIFFKNAEAHVQQLNVKKFGGYNDWRLPTSEEAMSLMEPEKHGELYLDPVFDRQQRWIWTSDKESAELTWFVYFYDGDCNRDNAGCYGYVRAVRS